MKPICYIQMNVTRLQKNMKRVAIINDVMRHVQPYNLYLAINSESHHDNRNNILI